MYKWFYIKDPLVHMYVPDMWSYIPIYDSIETIYLDSKCFFFCVDLVGNVRCNEWVRRWWFVFLSLAGDCFWAETRHIALLLVRDLCPYSRTPSHLTPQPRPTLHSPTFMKLNTSWNWRYLGRLCCIKMLMISDNIPPESRILLWQICGRFTGVSDWSRSGQVMWGWASIGWWGSGWQMCGRGGEVRQPNI